MKKVTKLLATTAVVITAGFGASEFSKASNPDVQSACVDLANQQPITSTSEHEGGRGGTSKYGANPSKATCVLANKFL